MPRTPKLDTCQLLALREAITYASDPEKTFFEDFPAALGMDLKNIAENDNKLAEFFANVNGSIEELKNAYSHFSGIGFNLF
ncbi:MAG: hypothetical protein U5L96_17550 [Owenweeksia sp.]|nr:hypothetical protein [Owenweeksia sp.]